MLFSFQIDTTELDKWHTIIVNDGDRVYRLIARKGHSKHVYMNIPVSRRPSVNMPMPGTFTELSCDENPYMSEEQTRLNRNLIHGRGTPYRRTVIGTPRRAIVTFPHFKGQGGWPAPYSVLDGSNLGLDDCLYLSFQDPYFHLGSYLLSDNHGKDPKPAIAKAIREELADVGLGEDSLTLLGSSKGAAAALMVSEHFTDNQLILCSLSTNLDIPIRKSQYSHIGVALDYYGVTYPSTIDLLLSEAGRKETHWLYSVNDHDSTQGNESKTAARLIKHPCEAGHSQVLGENLVQIAALADRYTSQESTLHDGARVETF